MTIVLDNGRFVIQKNLNTLFFWGVFCVLFTWHTPRAILLFIMIDSCPWFNSLELLGHITNFNVIYVKMKIMRVLQENIITESHNVSQSRAAFLLRMQRNALSQETLSGEDEVYGYIILSLQRFNTSIIFYIIMHIITFVLILNYAS